MSDQGRLVSAYTLSIYELEARRELPSRILREHEARLISEMARKAHLSGRAFDGWPMFTVVAGDSPYNGSLTLRAEVVTLPV